jgi:3-deoxy-D-manno-octulosonic-acid transferase
VARSISYGIGRRLAALGVDFAYLLAAIVASPIWLVRMIATGKIRTDWRGRFGGVDPAVRARCSASTRPRILLHAVSVGEVNAIRLLVEALARDPLAPDIVVAVTTDTGIARARALFGREHMVVRMPFDLSFAVRRFLDAVRPDVVALVELEVWPNTTSLCEARGIPVVVVNGRLSDRSYPRYRRIRFVVRPMFARLAAVSAQTPEIAARFAALGADPANVVVGGTMKWDTAEIADVVPTADALARELGIDRTKQLVVAGSTAPGEDALLERAVPPGVQLLVAPRKPEWCDEAAAALPGCVRRTERRAGSPTGRFVLDTIGELRAAYSLADLVVVGRSFGTLHGSDMMEPIALGKAVVVGPRTGDFKETMRALRAGGGIVETDADQLAAVVRRLLDDPEERSRLAARGRAVIRSEQGATRRNAELLLSLLESNAPAPLVGGALHA